MPESTGGFTIPSEVMAAKAIQCDDCLSVVSHGQKCPLCGGKLSVTTTMGVFDKWAEEAKKPRPPLTKEEIEEIRAFLSKSPNVAFVTFPKGGKTP
jgi:hypothetical protein